jgi:hypothetical protein
MSVFWDAGLPNVTITNSFAYNNLNNAGAARSNIGSITQSTT